MNKQQLINNGFKHICTQNSSSKVELYAKFNGYSDIITYLFYSPELDTTLDQSKRNISFTELDMMAQMRDKLRNDFVKMNLECDKDTIWS